MRTLNIELRSFITEKPWLAVGISFVLGILITFVYPSTAKPRTSIPGFKEGFLVVIATAKLLDPAGDLGLSGSKVQFVRHGVVGESAIPCIIPHPPLLFSANERNVTLSGTLEDLESTVLSISTNDLKQVDLTNPHDSSYSPCTSKVKIVYGQEEK